MRIMALDGKRPADPTWRRGIRITLRGAWRKGSASSIAVVAAAARCTFGPYRIASGLAHGNGWIDPQPGELGLVRTGGQARQRGGGSWTVV